MTLYDITLKQCLRKDNCVNPFGSWLPATTEYFGKDRKHLRPECRECRKQYLRDYHQRNRAELNERSRRDYALHSEHYRQCARDYRKAHPDWQRESNRRYYALCRDKELQRSRKYRLAHLDDERRRHSNYRAKHREELQIANRRYQKEYPDRVRVYSQRHRTLKRNLPSTLTVEAWAQAIEYFKGCCAVCERQLNDLFGTHKASMDHWIPLSSPNCPGTISTNIVPLCYGANGCNNSKRQKDPREWLIQMFGQRRAKTILKRIEAYFESIS